MDALAFDGVEIGGKRGDQRLTLTRLHFRDLAAMKHHAANHLHVEMPHTQHALGRLTHGGESFGHDIIERRALFQLDAELGGLGL